jgi:putative ABC transport system permease protein
VDTFLQDLRYAGRTLLRSPGFTAIALLTLALGIGANSAVFSVVRAVLLRPLPYPAPERLVRVYTIGREGDLSVFSPANFRDARTANRSLEHMSFATRAGLNLTGRGDAIQLDAARVGQDFFQTLGVRPLLGRWLLPEENEPGRDRVVVLSHALWQQRFGGDAAIVGRTVRLDGEPYEVVGVMPEGFSYPEGREAWVPMEYDASFLGEQNRGSYFLPAFGRLKPGVSAEAAATELAAIGRRLEQEHPETNTGWKMTVVPLREAMVGEVRPALLVLLGAVGLVLLIACANVANLLLARATAREGEMAVRAALGASRARMVRQLLTESLLLGTVGGGLGLLLALWGAHWLLELRPRGIPRLDGVGVDATVVAFTAGVAVITGLLFGVIPALQSTRAGLSGALKEGGRGALGRRGSARVRDALVVAEMALALVLLAGAGLLVRSFVTLRSVDPGFRGESVLTFGIQLPDAAYDTEQKRVEFHDRLVERLEALPGARSAAVVSVIPLGNRASWQSFEVAGREPAEHGNEPVLQVLAATPDYHRTLSIPLLAGRGLVPEDRSGAPRVAVLNESAVRRFFPDANPIGARITFDDLAADSVTWWEVVGVVGDVRQMSLEEGENPAVYLPEAQVGESVVDVVVRTAVPPMALAGPVKQAVAALDPNVPVSGLRPLQDAVARSVSQPRFYMTLLSIFAAVALALATIGIFGVVRYAVAQRTREIGIRMALGADSRSVIRLVVGGALTLAGAGVGLGVLGALAGTRLLSSLLYGVSPTDPLTFVAVGALLFAAALLASLLPARRATRLDPNVALRAE